MFFFLSLQGELARKGGDIEELQQQLEETKVRTHKNREVKHKIQSYSKIDLLFSERFERIGRKSPG